MKLAILGPEETHGWTERELESARRLCERLDDRDLVFVFTTAELDDEEGPRVD